MQLTEDVDLIPSLKETPRLKLFKIQRTCVYDGPGIRTTLFFQGCNLRCVWCQNPEGLTFQGSAVPDCDYTIHDIMEIVSRDKPYYLSTTGGVTLSGGEPLLQDPNALEHLLKLLKKENIRVSAETTLNAPWKNISKFAPYIDLFLVDLKVVGDDNLHVKLTQQDSRLIHENLQKLLALNANIRFRMVMVPGFNDGEKNIQAAAEFLKFINYDAIELMKFHNLYEEKAKKLGLDYASLNITPEQSIASIKNAVGLFGKYGIKATNTDLETDRHKAVFSPRVLEIQKAIREAPRALCLEACRLKTKYYKKNGFKKPVPIHRAERLAYLLQNKKVIVYPHELLVGNFTAKRVAGHVWEELYGPMPAFFLFNVNRQKPVSFQCSFKDILFFYFSAASFWMKHSVMGWVYRSWPDVILNVARYSDLVAGFNNNMASIAHFIANFERILKLGTTGLIEEIKAMQKAKPQNNQDFYKGCIIALEGLEAFAQRYADNLASLSKAETNPERRKELEEMSAICSNVPKYPARTYHEALQSILFLEIALCQEQYENAISYGRLDQILYPYYKKDKEAGRITYERAKELLCLFILKIDEDIFVNDGNSLLSIYRMVETLSIDQTVTFGGVDKDGNDATNDITYMLIDACELQTLAIDMAARIHEGSPAPYLERLAEAYLSGTPQPKIYSDKIYIESIQRHYPTTLAHARNYAIVGCVEPNASDEHFGNTDCANVNLALPFLQAIKGHEHDLWRFGIDFQLEKLRTNLIQFIFKGKNRFSKFILRVNNKLVKMHHGRHGFFIYNPPSSMDELLARFQKRLNQLTNSILHDHKIIERELREHFTTPLASSLFPRCVQSGKDVYEGGATFNSSGIQAVGVTDVADSLYAINEVVFKKKLYTLNEINTAIDNNFEGVKHQRIRAALLAVPKFGDDSSREATEWVTKVMAIYNNALDSVKNCPRNGRYSAGYYALNVTTRYGEKTQALPSGRLKGTPLANSVTPHYGMEQVDLLSALNSVAGVDFTDHAENGTTATFTIDSALFQGQDGVRNLANILKTFLTRGGMQLQPNIVNRELLIDAYKHPEKHPYLMVRIAGYCALFNELSKEMKLSIIKRTCYS